MYCPKCGRKMVLKGKTYHCKVGDMGLSERLHTILTERFPIIHEKSDNSNIGAGISKMYCPGCGSLLGNDLKCSKCDNSIADLGYQLIEFHPHLKEDGTWGV